MDQAIFKESLLKKRAEILSEGGAKPLQTWMGQAAPGEFRRQGQRLQRGPHPAENQADRRQDPLRHRGGALADGAGHLRALPRLRGGDRLGSAERHSLDPCLHRVQGEAARVALAPSRRAVVALGNNQGNRDVCLRYAVTCQTGGGRIGLSGISRSVPPRTSRRPRCRTNRGWGGQACGVCEPVGGRSRCRRPSRSAVRQRHTGARRHRCTAPHRRAGVSCAHLWVQASLHLHPGRPGFAGVGSTLARSRSELLTRD